MTWDCSISEEIGGMFDEYSWRQLDLDLALEKRCASIRARNAERRRDYRNDPTFSARERAATAKYRAAHPERVKAWNANWYANPKNRKKHGERTKLWKQRNREKANGWAREYQRRKREEFKARDPVGFAEWQRALSRRYRARNLEKVRAADRIRQAAKRKRAA